MNSIADVMTKDPITIPGKSSVAAILDTISKCDFDHLPVVNDEGELIGIISKSDIYKKLLFLSRNTAGTTYAAKSLEATTAAHIMTPNPISVSPHHTLQLAIEILLQGKFHALPVVHTNKVIGIVTAKDLLAALQERFRNTDRS